MRPPHLKHPPLGDGGRGGIFPPYYMRMRWQFYLLTFLLPLCFIFPYGKYRCTHPSYKDPLETPLLPGLDGWSASHFLFFMLVGYLFPKTFILSMAIGTAWELFEHYYGKERPGWLGGYGDCNNLATDRTEGNWWYGKWTDIVCNATGFLIGALAPLGGKPPTTPRSRVR
jgi:hypothetical protein